MITFKLAKDLTKYLEKQKQVGNSIGFIPTMGALHEGHLSLLKKSVEMSKVTVCSIFVNPTQFNNREDLEKYPRTVSEDILLLEESRCDILFLPDENEMYPDEQSKQKHFDLGHLETILEGKFRPGHFQGVCLVMEKLLKFVNPDFLFLGQKDFQQCLVIQKLVHLLHDDTKIIICPILREPGGLAMSSRNVRLSPSDRKLASQLHQALVSIENRMDGHHFPELKEQAIHDLENKGFKVEYLELAGKTDLQILPDFKVKKELIILVAAFLSGIRLIDNLLINP